MRVVVTGGAVEDPEHARALAARLRRLAATGTQVVLCGRPPLPAADDAPRGEEGEASQDTDGGPRPLTVAFDNRGGARQLTEHLIALGHRRIGYVAGPPERTTTRHRLEGHRAALARHGLLEGADHRTVHGRYDRSSGYDGAMELLRRDPELTAVLAANDTVALGVCAALRDQGLRIPEDLSVVGFDDTQIAAMHAPALTTVRQPLREMGAVALRTALRLAAGERIESRHLELATELIVRDSTQAV